MIVKNETPASAYIKEQKIEIILCISYPIENVMF